jgi:hypothetical protein
MKGSSLGNEYCAFLDALGLTALVLDGATGVKAAVAVPES